MPTVLITGSTGKQGGATIDALLQKGIPGTIKGLTRNVSSSNAQALGAKGVTPVEGNLTDKSSLVQALTSVDTAFLVTDFNDKEGVEGEVVKGKTFVDAAREAGVKNIVFTSVGSADVARDVPHFNSKYQVEEYLKSSGLEWSIIRPVAFMDNFPLSGFGRFMALGAFSSLLGRKSLHLIAVQDIGRVAAELIAAPEKYKGRIIELAGDELTVPQIQDAWGRATGSRPWRAWLPSFLVRLLLPFDMNQMFKFFVSRGYQTDVRSLRTEFPFLLNFEAWAASKESPKSK